MEASLRHGTEMIFFSIFMKFVSHHLHFPYRFVWMNCGMRAEKPWDDTLCETIEGEERVSRVIAGGKNWIFIFFDVFFFSFLDCNIN